MMTDLWAANPLLTSEFLLSVGLLVAALLAGAVVFFFVDRWRKHQLAPGRDSAETLSTFRTMFEQGEITETEYRKVRDRVAARMREEVALPAAGPAPAPPPAPAAPPPEPPTENTDK